MFNFIGFTRLPSAHFRYIFCIEEYLQNSNFFNLFPAIHNDDAWKEYRKRIRQSSKTRGRLADTYPKYKRLILILRHLLPATIESVRNLRQPIFHCVHLASGQMSPPVRLPGPLLHGISASDKKESISLNWISVDFDYAKSLYLSDNNVIKWAVCTSTIGHPNDFGFAFEICPDTAAFVQHLYQSSTHDCSYLGLFSFKMDSGIWWTISQFPIGVVLRFQISNLDLQASNRQKLMRISPRFYYQFQNSKNGPTKFKVLKILYQQFFDEEVTFKTLCALRLGSTHHKCQ